MNSRTLVGLMLVGLLGLASADHHEHHGSVCAMEADAQVALVECIQEHLDEATATKLNTVKERLECEQLHCVFQKMCERNQGTLVSGTPCFDLVGFPYFYQQPTKSKEYDFR
ncbi:hypothetical protein V5799_034275 [Amblyomma americanum]|uniref:Microplusin n=1 Tax=Amblyomma americanum TaxID=6943 RepID=A0AAQ4DKX7_AMBAM